MKNARKIYKLQGDEITQESYTDVTQVLGLSDKGHRNNIPSASCLKMGAMQSQVATF